MQGKNSRENATFDDRYTMRFVRDFPVPIERVWQAVTGEELNIWLYPVSRVQLELGGRASFTWGQAEHDPQVFKITRLDAPHLIRFSKVDSSGRVDHSGFMQFELTALESGTRFTFIDKMGPIPENERVDPEVHEGKDSALPGGTDTPWRPGFVAGFHLNMDALGQWLAMDWPPEKIHEEAKHWVDATNGKLDGPTYCSDALAYESGSPQWSTLVDVYYDYIKRYLPDIDGVRPEDPETYPGLAADLEERGA